MKYLEDVVAMRIAINSEVSRSLWLAEMKCLEIRTCCKAKYLIAKLDSSTNGIGVLEIEVKLILARL